MNVLDKLKVGDTISVDDLDEAKDREQYSGEEFGTPYIGKQIYMLTHVSKDLTLTFMLDGYCNNGGWIFKLVYKG